MVKITYLKKKELNKIKSLLAQYEFNDYRNYRLIKRELLDRYIFRHISDLLQKDAKIIIAKNNSTILGLVSLIDLPWETKYFGIKMAEMKYLIAKGSYEKKVKIKKALISFTLNACRQNGIRHLASKIDIEDFSSIHSLENCGFNLMGSHLTHFLNLKLLKIPKFKELCQIRLFKKNDFKYLVELTRMHGPQLSRFNVDSNLPRQKSKKIYVKWVINSYKGKFADEVLVAERNGKVVGFATYKLNKELKEFLGINCLHHSLLIVSPEGRGSSLSLLKALFERGKFSLDVDFVELDVYNYNYPAIRILQKIGMSLVRAKYIFHKWIKEEVNGEERRQR